MIFFRRIRGNSMLPSLVDGEIMVGVSSSDFSVGDVVVAIVDNREVIKRIKSITGDSVDLRGDNASASTDSRHYGKVPKSAILGAMKFHFVPSTSAPKVRSKYAVGLGWVLAGVMAFFAVVHLFRIDSFVPELNNIFNDRSATAWIASLIVIMEVFAVPYLLRMRLSVAARYISGSFCVLVPLVWLLISIWTLGTSVSTAQLGEFVSLPSNVALVLFNLLWLVVSYYAIWSLGYGKQVSKKPSFIDKYFSRLS